MTKSVNEILLKQPVLLFDGECGFCNKSIQFLLKHEKNKHLHFAPLQSEVGQVLRNYFEIGAKTDSIILIKNHSAYIKSCAALRLTIYMRGLWPVMMAFVIIPPFLRNLVYDFIAKRRMKWYGRVDNCALLTREDQERFLSV